MNDARRIPRIAGGSLAIVVALSGASCGAGSARNTSAGASVDDAGSPSTEATGACATDSDCAATVPPTSPANCATGRCNTLQGVCVYVAKDEDGDGHLAGNCASTNGVAVQAGDDCNDHDPNLYSGHPESCSTITDGGTVTWPTGTPTGICGYGLITCTSDTTQSDCIGTKAPKARDCTSSEDNDCDGKADSAECACVPPAVRCSGNAVETCENEGTWSSPQACVNQTCVDGTCQGSCAPGQMQCSATATNGVETCQSNGTWGPAASCVNQTCVSGAGTASCQGVCAPRQTQCAGSNGIETCTANGAWGTAQTCVNSTCTGPARSANCGGACSPGQTTCSGNNVETCSGGQFGNPTGCTNSTCYNGSCIGVCAMGTHQCASDTQPQSCNGSGQWVNNNACSGQWCLNGVCSGGCAPGDTTQSTNSNCTPVYAQSIPGSCTNPTQACTISCAQGTYAGQPCASNGGPCGGTPTTFQLNNAANPGYGVSPGAFNSYGVGANCGGSTNFFPDTNDFQVCPNGSALDSSQPGGGLTCNVPETGQGYGGTCSVLVTRSNGGILEENANSNCLVGMSASLTARCIPNDCSVAP
ncbi:MAG TPA: hypothetical protein VK762_07065 [Polyangiaceae bacterium]|jgi:hypothetical protein|nr:hypothetical protein [Polyangiaceae bacterium]